MAMSFSRPDPASPAQVADATFSTGRRGFDQDEVRDFLRMVSTELGRLHERERFLERELRNAQAAPVVDASQLDDEALTRLLGEETARVLNAARQSAVEIREKAEQAAARLLTEASDEAARRREEAEIEASRRRADAANDAEAELSMAKQQGREMVNEARAYRERVLSELARRRELAREQIEQLIHGRDRLMESFERARLVAVEVVAEMQPLGEPDEYVNLQPTTGPVPVMVARNDTPRDDAEAEAIAAADRAATAAAAMPVADDATHDAVDTEIEAAPDAEAAPDTVIESEVDTEPGTETVISLVAEADDSDDDDLEQFGAGAEPETEVEEAADVVTADDEAVDVDTAADDAQAHDDVAAADLDTDADADDDTLDTDAEVQPAADDPATDAADEASGDASADDDADDHVVVDLFARLRGGTTNRDDHADDAPAAAGPAADSASADEQDADDEDADDLAVEASPFEQRDADLTPLIVASAKKLKRVLADEQNEVLDGLRRNDAVADLDAIVPPVREHAARYRTALVDDLLCAANAGAQIAAPESTKKLKKADANEAIDHAGTMLDERLVGPLRDRLERCISEGDGDNAAITQKVRAVYREWKTQHIDETLDDVMRAAHGRGVFAATEPGTPTLWTTDQRFTACPDCDDNALEGAVAAGDPFPTGHTFAPAHPGCRCMLLPAAP
jgi:DivIVA domain-containing protein